MLRVNNLQVNYGKIRALKDITFNVEKGEIVTLIGANGAGKTTIMNAIMGLVPVSGGSIEFEGKNITNQNTRKTVLSSIVLSPEGRQVFPEFSVLDNLLLGGFTRKDDENEEMLQTVFKMFPRLEERRDQSAVTLSGGEQQMLAVGRAMMGRPKLLLLDEPSLGLAPLIVKEIFDLISSIRDLGTTVLLVEQNANMSLKIADRAYVIDTGNISLSGDAKELLASDNIRKAYLGDLHT